MTRLTLLILADAFRHDYVERTHYIRGLAASSRRGALREDFGFAPQAGYFGGLTPDRAGFTNLYCFDPVASPFGIARGLPSSRMGREVEETFDIRTWLEAEARARVTPFAASYLSSAEIPLEILPSFSPALKHAPWDSRVGYRTIFDDLRDRSIPFFCCGFPETNRLDDHSDRALVDKALREIQPPKQFAFVHLQELDGIGHAYGPESSEVLTCLDATDAHVATLVTGLERRFDRVDVVLFGDHGMVSVTGTCDVWAAIEAAGLRPGRDVTFFLDSTMARFWLPRGSGRARLRRALETLPGQLLDDQAMDRLELRGCDPRNGELFFLAHPGILIHPNFFQRRGQLVRGMHGYEPDCPDNQGVFLVHEQDDTTLGDLGVVRPTFLHSQVRRLLGLTAPSECARALSISPARSPYTQHPNPAAHAQVAAHMKRIVGETRRIVLDASAIVLTGSFGRGEGGVTRGSDGRFCPVNDYDVLVVSRGELDAPAEALRELGERLAREFDTDFVHISVWRDLAALSAPTLANYDVKYGSAVLWGDAAVFDRLPRMAAADIPLFEGVQLLFNRLAGLLTGLTRTGPTADAHAGRYLRNQIMKALMALGDWHLLRAGAYDASYRTRLERFTWLAPGLALRREQADLVQQAYRYKLHPDSVDVDTPDAGTRAAEWLVQATIAAVAAVWRRPVTTAVEAAAVYYEMTSRDHAGMIADNDFARRTLAGDSIVHVRERPTGSIRQAIYSAIPLVAAGSLGDDAAFAAAAKQLDGCLSPPWPSDLTFDNWDLVSTRLAHAWLTLVH